MGWIGMLFWTTPEVIVVDVRNRYEIAIGAFPGSLDPCTGAFREFPSFVRRALDPAKGRSVALYCTGGIRCEKASTHLLNQGFENVHQLNGGILGYLANAPDSENRWQGECFVFDQRVSVDRQLRQGRHRLCPACGQPLALGMRGWPKVGRAPPARSAATNQTALRGSRGKQLGFALKTKPAAAPPECFECGPEPPAASSNSKFLACSSISFSSRLISLPNALGSSGMSTGARRRSRSLVALRPCPALGRRPSRPPPACEWSAE